MFSNFVTVITIYLIIPLRFIQAVVLSFYISDYYKLRQKYVYFLTGGSPSVPNLVFADALQVS